MYTRLQSTRAFVYSLATTFDDGKKSNKDSAAVFLHSSVNGTAVANECM